MEQIRPLTALAKDELIARIEQYEEVQHLRDAEIRELHEANDQLRATITAASSCGHQHEKGTVVTAKTDALSAPECELLLRVADYLSKDGATEDLKAMLRAARLIRRIARAALAQEQGGDHA